MFRIITYNNRLTFAKWPIKIQFALSIFFAGNAILTAYGII